MQVREEVGKKEHLTSSFDLNPITESKVALTVVSL